MPEPSCASRPQEDGTHWQAALGERDAHVEITVFFSDFASLIESDVPIVVQHSRLDSRQAALALLSTVVAYGD